MCVCIRPLAPPPANKPTPFVRSDYPNCEGVDERVLCGKCVWVLETSIGGPANAFHVESLEEGLVARVVGAATTVVVCYRAKAGGDYEPIAVDDWCDAPDELPGADELLCGGVSAHSTLRDTIVHVTSCVQAAFNERKESGSASVQSCAATWKTMLGTLAGGECSSSVKASSMLRLRGGVMERLPLRQEVQHFTLTSAEELLRLKVTPVPRLSYRYRYRPWPPCPKSSSPTPPWAPSRTEYDWRQRHEPSFPRAGKPDCRRGGAG